MKKFTKWLVDNNFIIIHEWDNFLNSMSFKKDNITYVIGVIYKKPRYQGDPKYTGETISYYNLYITKGEYNAKDKIIASGKTQKELIDDFIKFLQKK